MKDISNAQWQKLNEGVFVYKITDNGPFTGRFAVRTILGRSNINYNDFRSLIEAQEYAAEQARKFRLCVYLVGFTKQGGTS